MDEQRKTVVATLKAVKLGQLTAEQAVAILKLAGLEPESMLAELQAHIPASLAATQNSVMDDADPDERLTLLLSDVERVERACTYYEPAAASTHEEPLSLEFAEEQPQAGISLDTRTLLSLDGRGTSGGGVAVKSRLESDLGRYDIKREFARGGMGRILLARDNDIGRDVALKELLPELIAGGTRIGTMPAGSADGSGDGTEDRFLREAKVTGQLEHPNIVPVYEIGERSDGSCYYTMKYVRGKTMAARMREIRKDETLSDEQKSQERLKLLDSFIAVCNAMAFAHSRGVIHRDIKPENVMLGDFGETMLLDWGLARVKNQKDYAVKNRPKERNISDSLRESADASKTQDGYIIGTPAYMPPEQGRGDQDEIDERSDIYSLGAMLYEILAGSPPFEGPTAGLVLQAMLTSAPAPLLTRNKFCPPELCAVVERAMAREKKDRFKTAMELSAQVQAFRDGRTLSVYHYSAMQLMRRYIARHRAMVSVIAAGLFLALAGSIYAAGSLWNETIAARDARLEAERARDNAKLALDEANKEEQAEQTLKRRQQEARAAALLSRKAEIQALKSTVESIRIDSLRADVQERVTRYERKKEEGSIAAIPAPERRENQVILSSLVGYISARESLLNLLADPAAAALTDLTGLGDLPAEHRTLTELRFLTAQLAAFNGDFALADFTLSGVKTNSAAVTRQREETARARKALLASHLQTVNSVLAEVRGDLQRPNRPTGAPLLSDLVDQLTGLRDRQTVELLEAALEPYYAKARRDSKAWTSTEYDEVRLILRALGGLDLPSDTVPVLARFLPVIKEPELLVECGLALCSTRSPEAFEPLAEMGRTRFNYIWENVEKKFALVPVPPAALKPKTADEFLKRSLARRARLDFDGAIDDCTQGLKLDPNSDLILIARAFARKGKPDLEGAITDFSAALALKRDHARALVARGNCYRLLGDVDAALADFSRSVELDSRNPTPYISRGLARMDGGDLAGALEDISKALEFDPRRAQTWVNRGNLKNYTGDWQGAVADYDTAIACDAEFAEAWTQRGIIQRSHNFHLGQRDLTRAAALNPTDARNYSWRAQINYAFDDLVGAVNDCTRAVELDPKEWMAWYYRAITYLKMDERRHQKQLAMPGTSSADSWVNQTASLDSAIADLIKTREIYPLDFRTPMILASAYRMLGDRLAELGKPDLARQAWLNGLAAGRELKQFNPYGAHFYNGPMSIAEVVAGMAESQARLDATMDANTPLELLRRGKAAALIAADVETGSPQSRALQLRRSTLDIARAEEQLTPAQRASGETAEALKQAQEALLSALLGNQFFADALGFIATSPIKTLPANLLYDVACGTVRLAAQYESNAVMRLGPDDVKRGELEYSANSLPDADKKAKRSGLFDSAFVLLEQAFRAGFTDIGQCERDPDLALLRLDTRWPDALTRLKELAARHAASDAPTDVQVAMCTELKKGGQAERAGLQAFDVIWTINGQSVSEITPLRQALVQGQSGERLTLVLRRYKFSADGDFLPKLGPDGKPALDAKGLMQWDFDERTVLMKRGTTRALGILGVGIGKIPAPRKP